MDKKEIIEDTLLSLGGDEWTGDRAVVTNAVNKSIKMGEDSEKISRLLS